MLTLRHSLQCSHCPLNCKRYDSVFIYLCNYFPDKRLQLLLLEHTACYNKVGGVDVLNFILLKYAFFTSNYNDTNLFLPLYNAKISPDRHSFPPHKVKEIHTLINTIRR